MCSGELGLDHDTLGRPLVRHDDAGVRRAKIVRSYDHLVARVAHGVEAT